MIATRLRNVFLIFVVSTAAAACGGRGSAPKKPVVCGNGKIDPGETCDPGIEAGKEGACLTECPTSTDQCAPMKLQGYPGRCNIECVPTPVACGDVDGCCPAGCSQSADSDCGTSALCGNGQLDSGELCDPGIPSGQAGACECALPGATCVDVVQSGSAATCDLQCSTRPVTTCQSGDGCCPAGCSSSNDSDCGATCGNGLIDAGETCDGNCPSSCDDGNACTTDVMSGSPAACNVSCQNDPIVSCISGDGCCPAGCDTTNDTDCGFCGDGVIQNGETCDGACPMTCDDGNACTTDVMSGAPATCDVVCSNTPVTACISNDGCCPVGCTSATDNDCSPSCGNGIIDAGETCDGNCPVSCNDGNFCTSDVMTGSAATCNVTCTNAPITTCIDNDGCCPTGCDSGNDNDCSPTCGNGVVDPGETCDSNCPTTCDDNDACTTDFLSGSAATCTAQCFNQPIAACINGDGCCPAGCTYAVDDDCACTPLTCSSQGWTCGTVVDDGCGGGGEACGTCSSGQSCVNHACVLNYSVGVACTTDSDCYPSLGSCMTASASGWTGGYCTLSCATDADCGSASHCGAGGQCLQNCASDADCTRPGYQCFDVDGDGSTECAPVADGSGAVGDPCTSTADCAGGQQGYCATQLGSGLDGGYCLLTCSGQPDCPSGSHCAPSGVCLANCSSATSCRSAGYSCYDADGDSTTECYSWGTGAGSVGDACAGVADCAGGQWARCVPPELGWPNGYCSLYCAAGQATCPSGATCYSDNGKQYCLDDCANVNQCRAGYQCTNPGTGRNECYP